MFRILSCLIVLGALAARAAELPRTTIRRVADIQSVTHAEASGAGVPFELEGWIVMSGVTFAFEDDSGAYNFGSYLSDTNVPYASGDRVRIAGEIVHEHGGIYAHCRKLAVLGHREPAPAVRATIAELLAGKFNYRLVTVRGEVSDVYKDEIAPGWTYFSIAERGQTIYLPLRQNLCTCDNPESLIGQTIEATGLYVFGDNLGMRQNIGRMFQTDRPLKILPSQSKGLFDVPELENCRQLGPSDVAALGRRRVRGTVLAVWHGNCTLLKANDGRLIRLNLVSAPPPRTGLAVEAVGVPGSDLYNVNLMRVRWRPTTGRPASPASPVDLAVRDLFIDDLGCHRINPEYHGRSIRFQGTVRGLPSKANTERQIVLESDGFLLPVDFSSCPEVLETLSEGCRVEITGVCVVDIDNWQPSVVFPRIKEILVVLPAAGNLKVLHEQDDVTIVNCGQLAYDIYTGKVKVPGGNMTYSDRYTFCNHKGSDDTHHPNPLMGYIMTQMTFCAMTGTDADFAGYASLIKSCKFAAGSTTYDNSYSTYSPPPAAHPFMDVIDNPAEMKGIQQLIPQYINKY